MIYKGKQQDHSIVMQGPNSFYYCCSGILHMNSAICILIFYKQVRILGMSRANLKYRDRTDQALLLFILIFL